VHRRFAINAKGSPAGIAIVVEAEGGARPKARLDEDRNRRTKR
jgi:hypothetical protein